MLCFDIVFQSGEFISSDAGSFIQDLIVNITGAAIGAGIGGYIAIKIYKSGEIAAKEKDAINEEKKNRKALKYFANDASRAVKIIEAQMNVYKVLIDTIVSIPYEPHSLKLITNGSLNRLVNKFDIERVYQSYIDDSPEKLPTAEQVFGGLEFFDHFNSKFSNMQISYYNDTYEKIKIFISSVNEVRNLIEDEISKIELNFGKIKTGNSFYNNLVSQYDRLNDLASKNDVSNEEIKECLHNCRQELQEAYPMNEVVRNIISKCIKGVRNFNKLIKQSKVEVSEFTRAYEEGIEMLEDVKRNLKVLEKDIL